MHVLSFFYLNNSTTNFNWEGNETQERLIIYIDFMFLIEKRDKFIGDDN